MSLFENSRNLGIHGGTFVSVAGGRTFIDASVGRSGIDRLYDSTIPEAAHDSYVTESKARCLEGTRTQYIKDITAWATGLGQLRQHRLLWMYGPAGVGKSAVAKSCAEKTVRYGRLGASFFFSRNNGVNDPMRFFTTIAHQLSMEFDEYRMILGSKVQRNPALLKKGLDIQFHELIIASFLELARRNTEIRERAVFVDGLDECKSDPAQCKIVELIANSVITHGDKVPLLWAFFSRPERHINDTFLPYFNSSTFWKVELPVSRDYDADIKLYFRDALHLPITITATATWPSEGTLDILVEMVAGLFIYAATIVRFVMDPNALSPQRQLHDVLAFFSQLRATSMEPNTQPTVTAELDSFYLMIMSRIPPKLLPVSQQILLIDYTTFTRTSEKTQIHVLANISGLTIQELENSLSKLHSVLALSLGQRPPFWEKPFPGSARILFYHASFMEFLLNPRRSRKYWIKDQRHYTAIAMKGARLFKELYMMNGTPRDERIGKLQKLLSVFPGEGYTSSGRLGFQDSLFYHFLCEYTLGWCAYSGLPPEIAEVLHEISLDKSRRFFIVRDEEIEILPKEKRSSFSMRKRQWELERPRMPRDPYRDVYMSTPASGPLKEIVNALLLFGPRLPGGNPQLEKLLRHACENSESLAYICAELTRYFSSRIRVALERGKKLNLEVLDDVELLDYYCYEWKRYQGHYDYAIYHIKARGFPRITLAAMSPWQDFFALIEGDDHRLTKAACRLLNRGRDGDLIPYHNSYGDSSLLGPFGDTLENMSIENGAPISPIVKQSKAELFRSTEVYYMTAQGFLPSDVLLSNLRRVASHVIRERFAPFFYSNGDFLEQNLQVCVEVLMEGHWEELFGVFEELLDANEDPDNYLQHIRPIVHYSSNAVSQLEKILTTHVKKGVVDTITEIEENKMSLAEELGIYAFTLLNVKRQQVKKSEWISFSSYPHFNIWHKPELHRIIDRAFDGALSNQPMWREAVDGLLAEQEGEVFRKLFYTAGDTQGGPKLGLPSIPHSDEQTSLIGDLEPFLQLPQSSDVTSRVHTTTPNTSRSTSEGNCPASTSRASYPTVKPNTSSQHTPQENRRSRKMRDKITQFLRHTFRRN